MTETGTPRKTLFELCLPLFLNSLLMLAVMLIDTMIISAYSEAAAAAVSIANQVLAVAYDFSVLLSVGGAIMTTHSLGRNDTQRAREIASLAVLANTVFCVALSVCVAVAGPLMVKLMRAPPQIIPDAVLYLYVAAAAITFNGFVTAAVSSLRSFSRTKTILALGVFANVFYLALDYVLVFGWGPVPSLGVFGSALATLLVRVTGSLILLVVLIRSLGLSLRVRKPLRELLDLIKRLWGLSYPSVLDDVAAGFYQLILVGFIAHLGVIAVLSRTYTRILSAFLTLVIMTISQGNEVLLGYHHGGGRRDEAHRRALGSAGVAVALSTVLSVVLYYFSDAFVGLFTDEPQIHRLAAELLLLTVFLQPVFALNAILFHSLKVVGDVYVPVIISQVVMWVLGLPLSYVVCVTLGQGVAGLWYVAILEEALKAAFMLRRWLGRHWQVVPPV